MKANPNPARRRRAVRIGLASILSAGMIASMAACSNSSSSTSGLKGKTLQMYTWVGNSGDKDQWQAYIDGGKLEDASLKVSFTGPAIGNYYTKLPTVLKGNDAPCIITLQNGQVPPYASALEPLESYAKDAGVDIGDYDKAMIKQLSADGKAYALPYDAEPEVVYYNKQMFKDAGVPTPTTSWTTDEFVKAAQATNKNGVQGFAIGQGLTPITTFMYANGEDYVKSDGTADLKSPALEKRFQFLVDLANKYKASKPLESSGGTFPDIDAFGNKQAAMLINGTWDLAHEAEQIGKDNLGVAVIPSDNGKPSGFIQGTGFAMTKTCGDKKAAFNAIAAMTSAKSQQSVAVSRTQVPARADSIDAWSEAAGTEAGSVVKALTTNSSVRPSPNNLTELTTLFNKYEVDAFSGKSSVKDVLQQVSDGLGQ